MPSQSSGGVLRPLVSMLLGLVAVVLLPVALGGHWASTTLTDTGAFVRELKPVVAQPQVQEALADGVTQGVLDAVDLRPVAAQALEPLLRQQAAILVASPLVATAWTEAVRTAHQQFVAVMRGDADTRVGADGRVDLVLRVPVEAQVLRRLGVPGAAQALQPTVVVPLVSEQQLSVAQRVYRATDAWGSWAPAAVAALGLLSVLVAVRRARALGLLALGWAVVAGACALGVAVARGQVVDQVQPALARTVADAAYGVGAKGLYADIGVALAVSLGLLVLALVAGAVGRARRRRLAA